MLTAGRVALPPVPPKLARYLEDRKLVGPRRESAEALEVVDPRQDLHERVIGALLGDVVELRARETWQPRAATVDLVQCGAPRGAVELRDRLLAAGMVGMQLRDPSARGRVGRR
jgi:hypothetical protein